jgi:hypothetical protein
MKREDLTEEVQAGMRAMLRLSCDPMRDPVHGTA